MRCRLVPDGAIELWAFEPWGLVGGLRYLGVCLQKGQSSSSPACLFTSLHDWLVSTAPPVIGWLVLPLL